MTVPSPLLRKLVPTSQPISLLPTPEANVYTHVHPILLLTLYYFRFPSLVASPVSTLLSSLIPLSILQITYTVLCLPPTPSGSRSASAPAKKTKSKRGPSTKSHVGISAKIVVSDHFAFYHGKLANSQGYQLAFHPFLSPDAHTRCTAPYRYSDPFRRSSDHSHATYYTLRYTYRIAVCSTSILRLRSGWEDVEGDCERKSTV